MKRHPRPLCRTASGFAAAALVVAVLPAAALDGASELMEGTGLTAVMAKVAAFEVPPPGVGLTTVTPALPAVVRSEAGIRAVSSAALT